MVHETITVRWYDCDCDWVTKHCDALHTAHARVPKSVLEQYRVSRSVSDYYLDEEEGEGWDDGVH